LLNVIHVTHEAVYKVGGIGTVLEGLINSRPYREQVGRTVLVCPLFYPENTERLGPGGIIEYSSLDGICEGPYARAFQQIEHEFNVHLVYGRRPLEDGPTARRSLCEVLLVDLRGINQDRLNYLKSRLWDRYGLQSDHFQHIWEYEQYVQVAAPVVPAMEAMRLAGDDQPAVVFAHEFMGLPTALALAAHNPNRYRTLFHAHEAAPIRRIVEAHPGHDVMFYNAMALGRREGATLDDVFGSQADYFKYAVVNTAPYCDAVLAVGHHIPHELEFQNAAFADVNVELAYNGVPIGQVSLDERKASKEHLRDYCAAMLGWRPTYVFTHVTRLAVSKALWRDMDVLEAMEPALAARGETAVMLVLSTELPSRPAGDIRRMESEWDWPLAHREGPPDLTGGEARYYTRVQSFNARARHSHLIYINQFGFSRERCGNRVPESVEFQDLRCGTDAEFGLSLYEPFGISPLEPLTFGAICVISTSCGCAGFVKQVGGRRAMPNVILADYIQAAGKMKTAEEALAIGKPQRREAERKVAVEVARVLMDRLPHTVAQERDLLRTGYGLARRMSWDVVAETLIFPAIQKACARRLLHVVA
jgi:hypothetical protein